MKQKKLISLRAKYDGADRPTHPICHAYFKENREAAAQVGADITSWAQKLINLTKKFKHCNFALPAATCPVVLFS